MKSRLLLTIIVGMFLPFSPVLAGSGKRIVDLATHQEMVLYSIATDYAMEGMRITYHDPRADISKRVAIYEQNNAELMKIAGLSPAQQQHFQSEWQQIKATAGQPAEVKAMQALYEHTKTLDKEFEALAESQAKKDHDNKEEVYVLVGELGMDGQRLAALYMMKVWETGNVPAIKEEINATFKEVKSIFNRLEAAQDKDAKAQSMVDKIEKHIILIEHLVDSDNNYPVLIEKSAEKLMTEVEGLLTYVSAFISRIYQYLAFV